MDEIKKIPKEKFEFAAPQDFTHERTCGSEACRRNP